MKNIYFYLIVFCLFISNAYAVSIKIKSVYPIDKTDLANNALAKANAVLSSDCFKSTFLNSPLEETQGMSNNDILNLFEKSSPLNVGVSFYYNAIQHRLYGTVALEGDPIRFNTAASQDPSVIASAMMHEGLGHNLGFRHDYNKNYYTSKTVPYTLNRIFDKCITKLDAPTDPSPNPPEETDPSTICKDVTYCHSVWKFWKWGNRCYVERVCA